MNKVILIGRLAREIEVKYTQAAEPVAVARFAIAVDRPFVKKNNNNGEKTVDFLNCVCFGKRGETIGKYFHKGNRIAVAGRIQTGEYTDKNGNKRYTTDIIIEDFDFVESKSGSASNSAGSQQEDGFYDDGEANEENLPF